MLTVRVYPLSRLVHAMAGSWRNLLAEIEEGKVYASRYYMPVREAAVRLCASRNRERDRERIAAQMVAQARAAGGLHNAQMVRANETAYEVFANRFLPQIEGYRRSFLNQKRKGCEFAGLMIEGAPHFEVDRNGRNRHVFLYTSDWRRNDLLAYLELLGVIVEAHYGGDSASLWVMNLRNGKEVKWHSSARIRKRCQDAARLYEQFLSAMGDDRAQD